MMRSLFMILIICMSVFACGRAKENYHVTVDKEVNKLPVPNISLTTFGTFKLDKMVINEAILEKKSKKEVAILLEQKIEAKLNALLLEFNKNNASSSKIAIIRPHLNSLRVISSGSRFFLGGLSGNSHIDMDLEIIDENSGELIARPRIYMIASHISGGYSMGASDQNLLNYITDVSYEYLLRNYKK